MRNKITRRDILQKGATSLALLPWLEYFAGSQAMAADQIGFTADGHPKRLCVLMNTLGTIPKEWVSGNPGNYTLGKILKPLEAHRDKMTIIRGLFQTGENGAHPGAQAGALTGRPLLGDKKTSNNVGGNSFDQQIADQISAGTPRRSIHMQLDGTKALCYRGVNQPISPLRSPFDAFDQYFAGVKPGDGGSTGNQLSREDKMNLAREQVLNDARVRYQALKNRVGVEDRQRLEQHLEGLNSLISRLEFINKANSGTGGGGGDQGSACKLPVIGSHGALPARGGNFKEGDALGNQQAKFNAINRTYMDITAQAFACDVTRVSVINIGKYHAHGGVSHKANVNNRGAAPKEYDKIVNAGVQAAHNINYFINQLSSIPEGNGSVMDNTLLFWVYELADGAAHTRTDSRHVLIGNAGGAFPMGRLIDRPAKNKQPHNELLTSMINCFGIPDRNFGHSKWHGAGRFAPLGVNI